MEIYIKPIKKAAITSRESIYIQDISEVFAPDSILKKIKNIKILEIKELEKKSYLVSVIDIITAIDKALPGHTINNVGEMDTIIEYSPKAENNSFLLKLLKIIIVVIILFAGSSTAIMSFHSDAQMATIFENYYKIFFNERIENPLLINIPYSIGIALGIIVFFNHFSGKSITDDPTPIEVQMSLYEADVVDNIIDTLSVAKGQNQGSKNSGGSGGSHGPS